MACFRFDFQVALLLAVLCAQRGLTQELPTYQEFDANAPAARLLRAEPRMLSRFPMTFSCAISPESKWLRTIDIDGRVWQWPSTPAAKPTLITDTNGDLSCAVFSDNGRWLALAEPDGSVALMDVDTTEIKFSDKTLSERTVSLRFAPDAKRFVGVTVGGSVRIWNVGTGKMIRELATEPSSVQTIAISPNGDQLAIASRSRNVTVHDIRERNPPIPKPPIPKTPIPKTAPRVVSLDSSRVTALAFSPNGQQLVIAAAEGTTRIQDLANDRKSILLGSQPFAIWSIAFERGGQRMAAGSWDGSIKLWDTSSWTELQSLKAHEESVATVVFDSEGGLVSAGLDGRLLYWSPEVASVAPSARLAGRTDAVWVSVFSPGGSRLFVGGQDKRFELWGVESKKLLVTREGHPTTRCAAFSPNGKTLATGGDNGKIFLHDGTTGEIQNRLLSHPGAVSAVVFADDGHTLVSVCDGGVVKFWDTTTGEEKATWREHKQQIYCANISPDGNWLVTGGGNWTTGDPGELIVWELKTGRVRAKITGHKLAVWNIVFTPDGKRFASSDSSGAVKVWNLETLAEERTLQHTTWVRALAMSPNGSTLAVGRGDGSVRLWDTKTWTQTNSCSGHESFSFCLQFALDGKTLASSGNDGTVQLWQVAR